MHPRPRSRKALSPAACCAALCDAFSTAEGRQPRPAGRHIVRRALRAPVRQIAENAGFDGAVVAGHMLDQKDVNYGFNARRPSST